MATDWGGYRLPAIWQMVQPENACTGADRVLAWEGLATAVREQHRRLLRAGADLAEVWPPERSPSALKFLNRIDDLAASMLETLTCAEDTRIALRGVTEALGEAQTTIRELAAGRTGVSTDWVPRFIDHAEDEYDERAQQAMRTAEATIAEHTPQIKIPPLYAMRGDRGGGGTPIDGGIPAVEVTQSPIAVPIDPVPPVPTDTGGGPGAGRAAGERDPVPGIGPGLSGVTVPPNPSSPTGGAVPTPPGGPSGGPAGPPAVASPAFIPGAGGPGVLPAPLGRPSAPVGRGALRNRPALPSGAVIGESAFGAGRGGVLPAPLGVLGSRPDRRSDGSSTDGKADERWQALAGVAPVIAPDARQVRHDPGSGVIGVDR